jgi:hypothetical protein
MVSDYLFQVWLNHFNKIKLYQKFLFYYIYKWLELHLELEVNIQRTNQEQYSKILPVDVVLQKVEAHNNYRNILSGKTRDVIEQEEERQHTMRQKRKRKKKKNRRQIKQINY